MSLSFLKIYIFNAKVMQVVHYLFDAVLLLFIEI